MLSTMPLDEIQAFCNQMDSATAESVRRVIRPAYVPAPPVSKPALAHLADARVELLKLPEGQRKQRAIDALNDAVAAAHAAYSECNVSVLV